MFPHMYKVRPPRPGRRGEAPSSAECEWQGDTRRRSNSRWNPNSWENSSTPTPSASTPASPLPAAPAAPPFATPPPIPAPPPEGQETLTKMTSPAARLDGVDATNQANFNASPMPWRRERSRTSSPAAKQTPVRRRERPVSGQGQEPDARTFTPPVPLEAVVVDATSPQPQTFTTTVPIVIERQPQDQKPETHRSASPLPAHQLQQQKQQRQQTPVQQLQAEDQQQQQQQRRRQRTSSPAVPPHHLQQEQQQTLQPAAAEVNSRDSRSASPAVVFQMDCDSPAVGQVPPVEKALPQENNAFIEDNMFLKENVPLECYAPMDVLPVGTDEFQDIMSTLGMDKDAMDEFRKVLDISNDIEPPPMETMEPPADNASTHDSPSHQRDSITRQPDDESDSDVRERTTTMTTMRTLGVLSPEPPIFLYARELTPTPPPIERDLNDSQSIDKDSAETTSQVQSSSMAVSRDTTHMSPELMPALSQRGSPPLMDHDRLASRRAALGVFSPEPPIFLFARELTPTPPPSDQDSETDVVMTHPPPERDPEDRPQSRINSGDNGRRRRISKSSSEASTPAPIRALTPPESPEDDSILARRRAVFAALSPEPPIFEFARELTPTPPPSEIDSIPSGSSCPSPGVDQVEKDDFIIVTHKATPHAASRGAFEVTPTPPPPDPGPTFDKQAKSSDEELKRDWSRQQIASPQCRDTDRIRRGASVLFSPEPPIFEFVREMTPTPAPSEVDSVSNGTPRASPEVFSRSSSRCSQTAPSGRPFSPESAPSERASKTPDILSSGYPDATVRDVIIASRKMGLDLLSPVPPIFEFARELTPTPPPIEAEPSLDAISFSSPEVNRNQINGIQRVFFEAVSPEPTALKSSQEPVSERPASCDREPVGYMTRETLKSPLITRLLHENGDNGFAVRRAASVLFSPEPPIFEFAQEITPTPTPPGTDSSPSSTPCSSSSLSHSYSDEIKESAFEVFIPGTPNSEISGRNMSETPPTVEKAPACVLSEKEDDAIVDTGQTYKSSILIKLESPPSVSTPSRDLRPMSRLSGKDSPVESEMHGVTGSRVQDTFRRKALAALSPEPPIFEFARELTPTPPPSEGNPESDRGLSSSPDLNVSQRQTQREITESAGPGPPVFDFARKSMSNSEEENEDNNERVVSSVSLDLTPFEHAQVCTPTSTLARNEGTHDANWRRHGSAKTHEDSEAIRSANSALHSPESPISKFVREPSPRDSPVKSSGYQRSKMRVSLSPQRTPDLSRESTPHVPEVIKNDVTARRKAALAALSPEPPIFEFARELTPTPPPSEKDLHLEVTPSPSLRDNEDHTNAVRKVVMDAVSPEPPVFQFDQRLLPTPPPEEDFNEDLSMNQGNGTLTRGDFDFKKSTLDSTRVSTPTTSSRTSDCIDNRRRAASALRSPDPPIFEFCQEMSPSASPSISQRNSNASLREDCRSEKNDKFERNGETVTIPSPREKYPADDLSEADLSSSSPESSISDSVREPTPVSTPSGKVQVDDLVVAKDVLASRRAAALAALSPEPPIFEFARELTPTPSPTEKDPDFDVTLCASPEVSSGQVNGTESGIPKDVIPELPSDEVVRELTPTPPPSEKDFVSDVSMSEDDVSVTLSLANSSSDVFRDFTPTPTLSDKNPIYDLAMWGSPKDDLIEAHRAAMEVLRSEGLIFDSDEDRTPTPIPSENKHVNGLPTVEEIEGKQPPPGSELAQVFAARKAAADHRGLDPAVHTFADLSSTPNKSAHFPEPHTTTSSHSSRSRQRPEDSIPVPTPPSQPQEVPHSHEDGNVTQESSTPVTSASHKAEKKVRARAASPEPPVIAPPPKSIPPPPPEMPGKHIPAPPPPPMPGQPGLQLPRLRPMTERKRKTIDSIKKAARSRPDWFTVMKDIESGVQLRRVDPQMKSDRSRPIMPSSRGRNGKFVYESEKPNLHNELLNQIQRGVRLRKTRTNDRSKVDFKTLGLRKLRRQVTVEEKEKKDDDEPLPSSSDEEEDIDKMRDDLQATKNQLCEELKSRKKLERENKIMKIDVDSLNAQIKKLKRQLKEAGVSNGPLAADDEIIPKLEKSMSRLRMREEEEDFTELDNLETEINNLKSQADAHKKVAEDWERKYHDMEQKLQVSETSADEWESRSIYFEKKFRALQKEHNIELPDIGCVGTQTDPSEFPCPTPVAPPVLNEDLYTIPRKSSSRRSFSSQFSRMESFREEESEESERSETEEEEEEEEEMGTEPCMEEDDGGDDEASVARRAENEAKRKDRDLKLWKNKLAHMKEKEGNVQRERYNLRERIKKYFRDMKTEREEYLKVKAEMDELAGVVKEPSEDEEESEEEEQEEELPPEAEDGSCWFEEPTPKPKKLKKRKKKKLNADGDEIEDDEEEEDLEDLSLLEEPEWTDSEYSESETDNEDEDFNSRLSRLSDRTRKHELHMNKMKKDNYLLKTQVERADEMYLVERRRHQRQDEELHMILAEM